MTYYLKSFANRHIAVIAFLVSFSLSPWVYYPWRVINSDGVLYLQLAYQANTQGLAQTFSHYNWPFFSIIISAFHRVFHLSYINSAYLLEAISIGFVALFFIKIVEKFGADKLTQWLALLVFLSFETIINYRGNIFRDFGYWALFLSAFYFLLEFTESRTLKYSLLWFFSAFTALFFRIEGMIFFILAPLVVFFFKDLSIKQKFFAYLKLYSPIFTLILVAILLAPFSYFHVKQESLSLMQEIIRLFVTHWGTYSLFAQLHIAILKFQSLILPKTAKDGSAFLILFIGMTGYFICKYIWTIGSLNFISIVSVGIKKLVPFKTNQRLVFYWLWTITLLVPYNFLLDHQFVSSRYMVSAALTALLVVPFALNYCATHPAFPLKTLFSKSASPNSQQKTKIFSLKNFFILYLICAVGDFIYLAMRVFYHNNSSHYVQASNWLYENRHNLPDFCSTDTWLAFVVVGEKIASVHVDSQVVPLMDKASNCQYIAFMATPSRMDRLQLLQSAPDWTLIKTFSARSADRSIYIYSNK